MNVYIILVKLSSVKYVTTYIRELTVRGIIGHKDVV